MGSSIRQKIISFTVLPITLIYILLFGMTLYLAVQNASRDVERHMQELAAHYADEVSSTLLQAQRIADTGAVLLAEIGPEASADDLDGHLQELMQRNPDLAGLHLELNTPALRLSRLRTPGAATATALLPAAGRWSTLYQRDDTKVTSYSTSIRRGSQQIGRLQVDITLDTLRQHLPRDLRQQFQLLDASGQPVAGMPGGSEHEHWAFYAPISANDWRLAASISRTQALAEVRDQAVIIAALLLLSLLLIIFCVWSVSTLITRPLRKLNRAVRKMARGELSTELDTGNQDETGELARSFLRMAAELKIRAEALTQARTANISRLAQGLRGRYYYFTHDLNGHISFVSPSITDVLGYRQEEFCGPFTQFLSAHPINQAAPSITDRVLAGESLEATYEIEMLHKDGTPRRLELFKVPVRDAAGEVIGAEGFGHDITEQHQDSQKFRALLESAPDAMLITDPEGLVQLANCEAENLFARARDQLQAMPLAQLISPALRTQQQRYFDQLGQHNGDPSHAFETRVLRADGAEIPVELTGARLETDDAALIAIALRDISARKQAEEALRQSEERYRRLVEGLQREYFFYSRDPRGQYRYVSPSVQQILGYSRSTFRNEGNALLSDSSLNRFIAEQQQAVNRGEARGPFVCEFRHADGSRRIMEVLEIAARNPQGEVTAIEGIAHDITRHKQAEEELRAARDAAETANRAKSQFLSNMSHELRTPLNGVLGYTQILLRDQSASPGQRQSLEAIESCGQHLLTLINDVLDLSKIDSEGITLNRDAVELGPLLQSVRDMLGERAAQQGLELSLRLAPDLPEWVETDATKLRQVLVNLVGNAIKFTPAGFVTLEISRIGETLQLSVRDSGIGIEQSELDQVFEPFKQTTAGQQAGGTGLGLAISRRLVQALGGQLEASSNPGKGSCFSFCIPLVRCSAPDSPHLRLQDQQPWQVSPKGHWRILITDDVAANRAVLVQLLEGAGFICVEAEDGEQALELLARQPIDLVLMDLRMPRLDGLEATRRLRQHPALCHLPVIAISANVQPELKQAWEDAGANALIGKPFHANELFETLARTLPKALITPVEANTGRQRLSAQEHADLEKLPPQALQLLYCGLSANLDLGDVAGIEQVADALAEEFGLEALSQQLRHYCRNFELEKLEHLLEQCRALEPISCSATMSES